MSFLSSLLQSISPYFFLAMASRGRRPSHPHFAQPSLAMKDSIDATKFYEDYVPKDNKTKMTELEEEVCQIREFHDDEEVEA
jgi:hypothetical protein